MTNVEVMQMTENEFSSYIAALKASREKPIYPSLSEQVKELEKQLEKFENSSFSDEDIQALHEDSMAI